MKNFSDLINENNAEKTYAFEATVKVKGEVKATSEGDAGELADKEMDSIEGLVDYTIDKLDLVETNETKEINFVMESAEDEALHAFEDLKEMIHSKLDSMQTDYYRAMLATMLRQYVKVNI